MAANPVTILTEMHVRLDDDQKNVGEYCKQIAHAVLYAECFTVLTESLDIYDLARTEMIAPLRKLVDAMLPKYQAVWKFLGQPRNYEEWIERRSALKTVRLGRYRKLVNAYHIPSMWDVMSYDERDEYHRRKETAPTYLG